MPLVICSDDHEDLAHDDGVRCPACEIREDASSKLDTNEDLVKEAENEIQEVKQAVSLLFADYPVVAIPKQVADAWMVRLNRAIHSLEDVDSSL